MAVAHIQYLRYGVQIVLGQGEHVLLHAAGLDGLLALHEPLNVPNLIAKPCGLFKLQGFGGLPHVFFQLVRHILILAVQERDHPLHYRPVFVFGALAAAGAQAAPDFIVHAGPLGAVLRQVMIAGAQGKQLL